MKKLKCVSYAIAFQEVPNEVSLILNLSGCPHACEGCHSAFLREDIGEPLFAMMVDALKQYKNFITCVCFMGGDHNLEELTEAVGYVLIEYGFKTCLYSGRDDVEELAPILPLLDYVKIGSYRADLGGLATKTTNQRMYRVYHKVDSDLLDDITSQFWRNYEDY